ncbi:hypothetical protein EU538_13030 [Candidatus Thorarchaeota archaeon]|nr:MAG: hypothetical protein EU538_13030 [Candidatus Thorarchaeota archaeon]
MKGAVSMFRTTIVKHKCPMRSRVVVALLLCFLILGFGSIPNARATTVNYYAVVVGISDYDDSTGVEDLSYADDDANDWHSFLTDTIPFDAIRVLGDDTSYYQSYHALATESNIAASLNWLVGVADSDDQIAVIFSGHGGQIGDTTETFFVTWEESYLYDSEIASILATAVARRIFLFLDFCHSGGFLDDLEDMDNSVNVFATSACHYNGVSFEDHDLENGVWTYHYILEWNGLIRSYGCNVAQ